MPAYSQRLWIRGLAEASERFVADISPARRARWDALLVADETPEASPREGRLYLVAQHREHWVAVPFAQDSLNEPGLAPHLEAAAWRWSQEHGW